MGRARLVSRHPKWSPQMTSTNRLTERELTARATTDIKTSNNGLTERELTAVELEVCLLKSAA
jgi:hypothetical protein